MLWSTVSKAADRSRSTSADRSPASVASSTSERTFRMAVSVEWWCQSRRGKSKQYRVTVV